MADNVQLNTGTDGAMMRTVNKAGKQTQVVTLDVGGAGAESLIAGALPVNVGNFPATQAVMGTVALDAGSLAALETISVGNFPASQAVTGAFFQTTQPVSGTVSVGNFPVSQAVTGTFFQTTQPISGTVSVGNFPVDAGLTDTQLRATALPVSGTFFQATQPVSLATNTPDVIDRASRALGSIANTAFGVSSLPALATGANVIGSIANTGFNATLGAETTKVIGTVNIAASQTVAAVTAITNALPAGTNKLGTVDIASAPATAKGVQGANALPTQDLIDSGRTMVTYTATALAGATAEALITLTPYRDLAAGTAAATHAVTAGKRLRIQTISLTLRSTSTVNVGGIVRFRMLAGAVLVTSPVHNSVGGMSSNLATAVIGNAQNYNIMFPDGFELSGTMQFGLTQLCSATSATLDIHVTGFEY